MDLRSAEFLAVDVETNGLAGDACELTEVGAVLVGGGELHDRFVSLVRAQRPLGRGIQRFTGITQSMLDQAPYAEDVLPGLAEMLRGRVLVAHSAGFDERALKQGFARAGLEWPAPPVLCTVALARRLLPLQRRRGLGAVAEALGIEVEGAHRALVDAETCARVFCALFPKLCAHAATIDEARALLRSRRPSRPRPRARPTLAPPHFGALPRDPGVYVFRDAGGRPLYVGKSVSIRSRARAHFAPSAESGDWRAHAAVVDYRSTASELGALVLECRLIKELRPPGNKKMKREDPRLVYVRCRLDIPFPVLEVAPEPAAGHAVTIGPLRGRRSAVELVEQLDSLFGLRHCGRKLPRRMWPSAYGQMGRCLSPCLGDLDPNLYRRRLDAALGLFTGSDEGGARLLDHVGAQMQAAAGEGNYERAAALRRRRARLEALLERLGGVLRATHSAPRLVLARHPAAGRADAFWLVGGRVVDWGEVQADSELEARTEAAVRRAGRRELAAHVPATEIDELRAVASWLDAHPDTPVLALDPVPAARQLAAFVASTLGEAAAA